MEVMPQSGPSTGGGQSSNPPHIIPHDIDVRVLYASMTLMSSARSTPCGKWAENCVLLIH